jgi:hypothetical protein
MIVFSEKHYRRQLVQRQRLDAGLHLLHYNLGFTLIEEGRDPERVAE